MLDPLSAGAASAAISWVPELTRGALFYYLPNLFLDLVDVFRFDLGLGVSYGAVARLTPYGQMGARGFMPMSARFGLHGRYHPFFIERRPEYGFGPGFNANVPRQRSMTPAEIGLNLDVPPVGVYAGLSFDELLDFVLGIIFIDYKGDNIRFR